MKHSLVLLLFCILTSCEVLKNHVNQPLTSLQVTTPEELAEAAKADTNVMAAIEQVRAYNANNKQDKAWIRYTSQLRRSIKRMSPSQQGLFATVVMVTCSNENEGNVAFLSLMSGEKGFTKSPGKQRWQYEAASILDPIGWLKSGFIGQSEVYFLTVHGRGTNAWNEYRQIRDSAESSQYPRSKVPACLMKLVR